MSKRNNPKIHLVRSDMGDGGWSLHARRLDSRSGRIEDEYPLLISGSGRLIKGQWANPPARAYAAARRAARALRGKIEPA